MSDSTTVSAPQAFLRYARKSSAPGNFSEASLSVPIDATVIDADFWKTVDADYTAARAAVLDALGIEYDFDAETGKIVEKVPEPTVSTATAAANVNAAFSGDSPSCPKCGSDMWDNRATKKNPRQPDFKCKEYKNGCDGAVWPPR